MQYQMPNVVLKINKSTTHKSRIKWNSLTLIRFFYKFLYYKEYVIVAVNLNSKKLLKKIN